MKIGWIGNALFQPTGYGRVAHYVLPYLEENTDHEVIQFCCTGLRHNIPFEVDGIKLYGQSGQSHGKFGVDDLPHLHQRENIDIWVVNFDAWTVAGAFQNVSIPYVIYPPIDHDPLPPSWVKILENAKEIVPYCEFGERVIKDGLNQVFQDNIKKSIYHGTDIKDYKPVEVTYKEAFGRELPEGAFVAGIFKNNQGTRPKYDVQLRGFKKFIDMIGPDKPAFLYIHATSTGNSAYDLTSLVKRYGLSGRVMLVNQSLYRYALEDEKLNKLYNACDITLNVTASEGFGLTITEAMAAGTPVIAGGFSSMPELLSGREGMIQKRIDGVKETDRGWLVPVANMETTVGKLSERANYQSSDIGEALYRAYSKRDKLEGKGQNGREWIKGYSWEKINKKWVDYFDGLEERLNEKGKPGDQNKKKAYLVVGAESSGTRIHTKILTELGCEGDTGHKQKFDTNLPTEPDRIVWRRSVPHDGKWPNLQNMSKQLRQKGYQVMVVVTMRDHHSTLQSQINADYLLGPSSPQKAHNFIQKAYKHIFSQLGELPYILSSYDNLVTRPDEHIEWMKGMLDLEGEVDLEIEDMNQKYYGDQDD